MNDDKPIRLDQCQPEWRIRIPYETGRGVYGSVVVSRIKPLARAGMVQMKFRGTHAGSTVRKVELPAATMVTRERPVERRTAVVDGIEYQATSPGTDLDTAIARARLSDVTNRRIDGGIARHLGNPTVMGDPSLAAMVGLMALGLIGERR